MTQTFLTLWGLLALLFSPTDGYLSKYSNAVIEQRAIEPQHVRYNWLSEQYEPYLSKVEVRFVLVLAGFEGEPLREAMRVVSCESGGNTGGSFYTTQNGSMVGMFQLQHWTWGPYCGVSRSELFDPLNNALCARRVYEYDITRNNSAWRQWQCKP
jgi:hypothetical protein